jgi:hypothetical protein
MNALVSIFFAHFLNWSGLHLLRMNGLIGGDPWGMLFWGYLGVSLISYLLLRRTGQALPSLFKMRDGGLALGWSASVLGVYAALQWDLRISPAFVFMGQSAAPVLVGLWVGRSIGGRSRTLWVLGALTILLILGLERSQAQLQGNLSGIFLIFLGFVGAQVTLRGLLRDLSVVQCSLLISTTLATILLLFHGVRLHSPLPVDGEAWIRTGGFAAVLGAVQLLVLTGYKKGDLLLTSLAQGSGVLIGIVMDSWLYGRWVTGWGLLLALAYLGFFIRITTLTRR